MKQCGVCKDTKPLRAYDLLASGNARKDCRDCLRVQAKQRMAEKRKAGEYKRSDKEKRRKSLYKANAAQREGSVYIPEHAKRYLVSKPIDKEYRSRAKRNARDAWRYWVKVKASNEWLDSYYSRKPWTDHRLTKAEAWRAKYRNCKDFAIKERMRRQVRKAQNRCGIADVMRSAITRGGESKTVERKLGYTIQELRTHIERQFTKGMSWDAFMGGAIHIDHVRPQASFDLSDDDQWEQCWHMANLQPLWARDNLSKGKSETKLL